MLSSDFANLERDARKLVSDAGVNVIVSGSSNR